jgi:glycosyltransferase involved in cell wall biosynthesis
MAPPIPAVSVIVPARDAEPTLDRTLRALQAQTLTEPYEIVVVDDGSRDTTPEIAERHAPRVRLVRTAGGEGPGAARNRGAREATAPVLAFTDADCFPTPDWLARALAALAGAELVQGAVAPDPATPRTPFDRTVIVDRERGLYQTANLLVRRDTFDRVGGFHDWALDPNRLDRPDRRRGRARRTPIGEDTLFAWEARRRGARTRFATDAVVHHEVVPGTFRDDLEDRWHWGRDMPALARRVPELRRACFYRRWFFHRRTADFDLAAGSLALALITRRRLPLLGVLPYLRWGFESASGPSRLKALAATVCGDAMTCGALLAGSARWRSVLL